VFSDPEDAMSVKFQPTDYHTATPTFIVEDAKAALAFYARAFGAKETARFEHDGKIMHAEIQIGDSRIMLGEPIAEMGFVSAKTLGGSPASIMLYLEDVDAVFKRAIAAGAVEKNPLRDEFYGDRSASVIDPFGMRWILSTHKEDVSPEEMEKRFEKMMAGAGAGA
jgi:PhnB protein